MNEYFIDYLKLVKTKPISKEISLALDRIPMFENMYSFNKEYVDKLISFMESFIYLQKGGDGGRFKLLTEQKFWVSLFGYAKENGVPAITELPIIVGARLR
ncbi:MAG: hypothetical protein ACRDBE_04320 [Leuconostoc lactis]